MSLSLEYPPYTQNLGPGQAPWVYPGGEVGIRIPAGTAISKCTARMQSAQDIIQFIMASRGREEGPFRDVLIPYLPYARQDRVAAPGDPNAIHVFADLIREAQVLDVFTLDAHSPEAEAAFRTRGMRLHDISPIPFFMQYFDKAIPDKTPIVLVSPDKGATQKTLKYAAALEKAGDNVIGVIQCAKVRDPETGKLAGFCKETFRDNNGMWYYGTEDAIIEPALVAAKPEYVIVDDICDGGGTFIGIRESLFKPEDKVHLWTTHGIYSKGLWPLLKCFSTVGSTDSFLVDGCASGESYHKVRI